MTESPDMELLAPAGNPSVALAAFDAGADAVYCGLRKFNARERSENFSHDELAKVTAYAHKNRRKVYVTFNTLLKECELADAAREMAFLAECRPDAVIVQDLGAAAVMRDYFPELTLHASTQLGIHNSAGLEMAKRFGFKRVILERQVTLEELRSMVPGGHPPLEMELFVHGALCCCVSGSCLFSSWLGGWSGNRGKCKQPCRRSYSPVEKGNGAGGFLFSPGDLCALELLDDFRKLGICSLKIEGRLRRADYVEKVVRAYRMVLDAAPEVRRDALAEANMILRGAVTRKTSIGFYSGGSMRELVRRDAFGGSGIPCGVVKKLVPGGFEAEMSGRLHLGDTIRLQTDPDASDGLNMTVLYLEKGRSSVKKVLPGERCFIRSDKKTSPGDLIYRTGESSADCSDRVERLPLPKPALDLQIRLERDSLQVRIPDFPEEYHCDFPELAPARNHAVSADDLERVFAASGSDVFAAGSIRAAVKGEWFLPAGQLKDLKRTFWSWAEQFVPRDLTARKIQRQLRRFLHDLNSPLGPMEKFPDCTALEKDSAAEGCIAREIDSAGPSDEIILPPFVPEGGLAPVKQKIAVLLECGARVFRITSFFQFALFPETVRDRIILKTMFPFPVCNSQCIRVCRECGAVGVQAWIELGQGDYPDLLDHSVLPLEAYVYGRPCIFMTRAGLRPESGHIRDARGNGFELAGHGAFTELYPDETLRIETPEGYSAFRDLRNRAGFRDRFSDFNYSRGWS